MPSARPTLYSTLETQTISSTDRRVTFVTNTRIEAHDHPDDRVATVVSGTWYLGYGSGFDEKALKALPPGRFYTEPAHEAQFARTADQPVVVDISGYGPTGTRHSDGQPPSAPRR